MEDLVVLQTKLGKLRGRVKNSIFSNKKYHSFIGIPFGKPPVGDRRFKAAEPFGGWEGTRDALEDGHQAKQAVYIPKPGMDPNQQAQGDEDCLYLCVYVNELPKESSFKKPVMVNIHGGGFAGGSGNSASVGPDYFLESDIVFVSFNYRCGAFGFLSLETEEAPGNAGLKDQVLALKWVRDNIDSFGGDPDNITIFGVSAGGASVHYHLLSPLSKGLFHKAIVQSGWSQNPWAFQSSPRKFATILAKRLGCKTEEPEELLKFLQSVPSDDIVIQTKEMAKDKDLMMCCGLVFSPCVEAVGSERFLPDHPNSLMSRGDYSMVPTIQGLCQSEGTVHLMHNWINGINLDNLIVTINNNPEILVPSFLNLKSGSNEEEQVHKAIRDFYFKGEPLTLGNFSHYMEYQSDQMFNIGFGVTRRYLLANSTSPVYTYMFTNHTRCMCSMFKSLSGPDDPIAKIMSGPDTCHGADFGFLFISDITTTNPELTSVSKEAISRHIESWTKFALTGDPNSEGLGVSWEEDCEMKPSYMDIGTAWELKEGIPYADRMNFWKELTIKFGQH